MFIRSQVKTLTKSKKELARTHCEHMTDIEKQQWITEQVNQKLKTYVQSPKLLSVAANAFFPKGWLVFGEDVGAC